MKPPPFEYLRPLTVDEVLRHLADDPDDSKLLAGGQSLVPVLNFRMAGPDRLIDLNRVAGLAYLRAQDSTLRIGAMTRHATLEKSALVARRWPLLVDAITWVAHPAIRTRGTIGGSVSHADPAAELPVAFAALDASFVVRSLERGERVVPWKDFFVTTMTTSLEPDEMLTEVRVPALTSGHGHAFEEIARRHGDFGLAGAAAIVELNGDGSCRSARLSLLGAAQTPVRVTRAEEQLAGEQIDDDAVSAAAELAMEASEPVGDMHGSEQYRRSLIGVAVQRALKNSVARAEGGRNATAHDHN